MTEISLKISVTEGLIISALVSAFENKTETDHIILNKKYGAMAYDIFTPKCYLETPNGNIGVNDEEKKECWKTSKSLSKFILKNKHTKEDTIAYYKCALLCRIAKNAKFYGWEFITVVPKERTSESFISVQFYERKFKKEIESICKDKERLKQLCTLK